MVGRSRIASGETIPLYHHRFLWEFHTGLLVATMPDDNAPSEQPRNDPVIWNVQVGAPLNTLVEVAITRGLHISKSELIRHAVKKYLEENGLAVVVAEPA